MIESKKYFASTDVETQNESDRDSELLGQGAELAAGYGGYKALSFFAKSQTGQDFLSKRNYDYLNNSFVNQGSNSGNIFNNRSTAGRYFGRDLALESLRTLEEISPGKILRTFQFSHLLSPISTQGNFDLEITGQHAKAQSQYLSALIKTQGDQNFQWDPSRHERFGFRVEKGALYEMDALGNNASKVLDDVMVTSTSFQLHRRNAAPLEYRNPLISGYTGAAGFHTPEIESQLNRMTANKDMSNLTIIGGKNAKMNWMQSYAKTTFMRGVEALGNPIGETEGWVPSHNARQIISGMTKLAIGDVSRGIDVSQNLIQPVDFGKLKTAAQNFNWKQNGIVQGLTETLATSRRSTMMGTLALNIAKQAAIRYAGFQLLDSMATSLAPDDSAFNLGIKEGLATAAVQAHMAYASTVGDPLQDYKNEQERLFSGSTSIMTLAGLSVAPAMTASIYSYGSKVYETMKHGKEFAENATAKRHALFGTSLTSQLAHNAGISPGVMFQESAENLTSKERTFRRLFSGRRLQISATRAALPGLLLALPFLPGALAGDSSEQLAAEYSGQKEVAVRANRWWGSGANAFEGDHIKYFRQNWYAEMMSGAKTASLYGDKETESELNPFLNPLDYIRDPYQFEKLHQKDRPYAVWGMDVQFGNFFGKMFENTIGAILKPDVINPELEKHLQEGNSLEDAIQSGTFAFEETGLTAAEKSLIDEGLMLPDKAARYTPESNSAEWSVNAAEDLVGLSGWLQGLIREHIGIRSEDGPQLSRQGSATNVANDIADMQLGGAFGTTESLRRFIPTNAWSREKGVNPLKNEMPSWLPGTESGYFMDFSTGDPYSKIEKGFARLPGQGYGALHEDVKGLSPEDYPEIYRLKILSDVAVGSTEYRASKTKIEARESAGTLTDYEAQMLATIREQTLAKRSRKQFDEYLTDEDYNGQGIITEGAQKGWQMLLHNMESPLEDLTFFRPGGKLIHKRTAVEDYLKTQVHGQDTAMWTEYLEQFLKPAVQRGAAVLNKEYVPEDVEERRAVDEYFDRLEYMKYKRLQSGAENSGDDQMASQYKKLAAHTTTGANASGYDTIQDVQAAYAQLAQTDKDYFSQFINLEDEPSKELLLAVMPDPMKVMYKSLWERREAIKESLQSGGTLESAMMQSSQEEYQELISENKDAYEKYTQSGQKDQFREYLALESSKSYVEDTTGTPDESFIGWDPRIDMNQVKLRTLTLGEEEMHQYGFWESDMEKLKRMVGILKDETVTRQLEQIKSKAIDRKVAESEIADRLHDQGYDVHSVEIRDSKAGDFTINVRKESE